MCHVDASKGSIYRAKENAALSGLGDQAIRWICDDAVKFLQLNLIDREKVEALGQFDAVLCRNVLIYFRDQRVLSVVDALANSLAPDGILAVGVSESLLRFGTTLVCEERGGAFFYRKARK